MVTRRRYGSGGFLRDWPGESGRNFQPRRLLHWLHSPYCAPAGRNFVQGARFWFPTSPKRNQGRPASRSTTEYRDTFLIAGSALSRLWRRIHLEKPCSGSGCRVRSGVFACAASYFGAVSPGSGTTMVRVLDRTVTLFSGSPGKVSLVTVISYVPGFIVL